ncbi:MAG: DUF2778 domain-containing protein [Hoeflea sp.]|nr:DUF2778 domain-containing protein [Hoeflea sp.]
MPASLHTSTPAAVHTGAFDPGRAHKQPRVAPASRALADRDALKQAATPLLADIDPQRFSGTGLPEQASTVFHDTWTSGVSVKGEPMRAAGAVAPQVSHWDQRTGPAPMPDTRDPFSSAILIALALAEIDDETDGSGRAGARGGDVAAGGDNDTDGDMMLAMAIPVPEPRPRIAERAGADAAQPQAAMPQPEIVPAPRPARSTAKKETSGALAYANPDVANEEATPGGIFGRLFGSRGGKGLPGPGSKVAVYDIGSATVHMPNGEKLEAHSGLAHMQDDPRYVTAKNRGPTPPNLYNLRMRESRFHGVEAIRLLPADGRKKYNRDGLLAHTYMYVGGGDRSQSNGCVVFKKYDRFLTAFKNGEVERLIVVPSMEELPTYMAAL